MSMSSNDWFWSQGGTTMGPIDLAEMQRLVAGGAIARSTWVFAPARGAWVAADSIPELFPPAAPAPGVAPPPDAAPTAIYCRFCGARNAVGAARCGACARDLSATGGQMDPKVAKVVCRACVLATPVLSIFAFIGPAIVWSLGSANAAIVAESKQAINCLITITIAFVVSFVLSFVVIGLIGFPLIVIYCIVVGILGLVAASNDREFKYPLAIPFLR